MIPGQVLKGGVPLVAALFAGLAVAEWVGPPRNSAWLVVAIVATALFWAILRAAVALVHWLRSRRPTDDGE